MADHALEALAASRIHEAVMLGRRGAARAERTAPRRITLRFLASPVELLGSGGGSRRCGSSATSWSSTTTAASAPRAPAR
jgi:hypothetical protein